MATALVLCNLNLAAEDVGAKQEKAEPAENCDPSGKVPDPNFHIYICFGQSNMEGVGVIEEQDKIKDDRFLVFQSLNCPNLGREKHHWYSAIPPLCNCWSNLSVSDYFGRTMANNLPDSIKIGVINVAVGGCDIRLFDKDLFPNYTDGKDWFTDKIKAYNGNPYKHLIELVKLAQKDGVVKGVLLHQGETNTGDAQWPMYVKAVFTNMMEDLSLSSESIPLIAGEVLAAEKNCCSQMNAIINTLPQTISNAHVVSSAGCEGMDNAHFNSEGYRILGKRYAEKMLSLMLSTSDNSKN